MTGPPRRSKNSRPSRSTSDVPRLGNSAEMSKLAKILKVRIVLLAVTPLLLVSAHASAEPVPSFPELLRQAQGAAPLLAEGEANVRAVQGRADQVGVRPNPVVALEVENFAGSRPYGGLGQSQTTLSASQTLELGGKRDARLAAGRAQVEAAQAQRRQASADFAYQLALAYVAAEVAQARVALLTQDMDRAQDDLRVAKALVNAGREAELRSVQAQAAVTAVRADIEGARADAQEALGRLSAMVASPSPYTKVGPSLLARAATLKLPDPAPPTASTVVAAAQAERDAAARRVNVERTRAVPDVTLSLGVRRLEGEGATALVGGISAPLPLFDRNRGSVSAARAELDAADARLRAARLDAEDWPQRRDRRRGRRG
jgi:cobalt-zinc-cadmium efflux system outer membrane protein